MAYTLSLRARLALGAAALIVAAPAYAAAAPAPAADEPAAGTLVVTAQRKPEAIETVPLAVSAFSGDRLRIQRLDGGQNLEIAIPNANYSRSNYGGYNFQIRGIGNKVVGDGGTAGVSFNVNELPISANDFNDTDFFDVQRVEVLRGPQGTLYGRNATGGAVNVVTNQPTDRYEGSLAGEVGNYDERKINGFVNMPLSDVVAVRLAGYWLDRDGVGVNSVTGDRIDRRNLGSIRATISYKPNDRFSAYLMYQHDQENDSRNRVGKQLCIKDPGPASVGGVPTTAAERQVLTQGCLPGSLYQPAAYGTLNTSANIGGWLTNFIGLTSGDTLAGHPLQDTNLHDIESAIDPVYNNTADLLTLHMDWQATSHLKVTSITGFNQNSQQTAEDYDRLVSTTPFNTYPNYTPNPLLLGLLGAHGVTPTQYFGLLASLQGPGGVINDPQTGISNRLNAFDYSNAYSYQVTQELRLQSSYSGRTNFSAGVYFSDNLFPDGQTNYIVESNGLTAYAQLNNALGGALAGGPISIDLNNPPTGLGHNYYNSRSGSDLKSYALFSEIYYNIFPDLKLTVGARYTIDDLHNTVFPLEAEQPGSGFTTGEQHSVYDALTGRVNLDWTPTLSFTDKTLVYATYSRGYKGGGFNTPGSLATLTDNSGYPLSYRPEFINAFEIGTKNVLAGGRLMLNADVFYYDYDGYQISEIVGLASVNQNVNAKIYGAEFEGVWAPVRHLTFNAEVGWLHTQLVNSNVIDPLDATGGNPAYTLVNGVQATKCIVDTAGVAALMVGAPSGLAAPLIGQACSPTALAGVLFSQGFTAAGTLFTGLTPCTGPGAGGCPAGKPVGTPVGTPGGLLYNYGPNASMAGVARNLNGNSLPNSPEWTLSVGAQYVFNLPAEWTATLRGDYYWQASSFGRIFTGPGDYLKGWDNVNATLNFEKKSLGLSAQLWVKNLLDSQPITDIFVGDPSVGSFTNTFTLDPRTFGVSVTKKFH